MVDGKTLDSDKYTVKEGSTIVTFKNAYLDALSVGTYKITFVYDNGSVDGTLYVVEAGTQDDSQDDSDTKTPTVKTGDNAQPGLWLALMGLSCAALLVGFVTHRKRARK